MTPDQGLHLWKLIQQWNRTIIRYEKGELEEEWSEEFQQETRPEASIAYAELSEYINSLIDGEPVQEKPLLRLVKDRES